MIKRIESLIDTIKGNNSKFYYYLCNHNTLYSLSFPIHRYLETNDKLNIKPNCFIDNRYKIN